MNPKKPLPLDENLEQRFFGVDNVFDLFNFSSLKRDLSKKLLPFDSNVEQRFF
jgi:hypothetical protein